MASWREDIITVEEMADHLGVDGSTVSRACRDGRLPAVKMFGRWVVIRRLWLEKMEAEAMGEEAFGG